MWFVMRKYCHKTILWFVLRLWAFLVKNCWQSWQVSTVVMIFPLVHESKTVVRPEVPVWPCSGFRHGYIFHSLLVTEEETLGKGNGVKQEFEPGIPKSSGHIVTLFPIPNQNLNVYMTVEYLQQAWSEEQINSLVFLHGNYVPIKCFVFQKSTSANENPC